MRRTVSTFENRLSKRGLVASRAQTLMATAGTLPSALRACGIEPVSLTYGAAGIDLPRYCALIEAAAEQAGNDSFGLTLARDAGAARLGLLGEMAQAAPNLGAALESLAGLFEFQQHNTVTAFLRGADGCRFEYRILDGRILKRRQDAEYTLATLLSFMRQCLGSSWLPAEVHFEHPEPAATEMHNAVFGAALYFSMATNALVFREAWLDRPMPGADIAKFARLRTELLRVAGDTGSLSLTDHVLGEIRSRLASGYPHIEDVADALHMTRWTLQRRLAEQGQVFSDLVENTRRNLAEIHLSAAHMPIQEIADVLGYSELSAFTRACVRWFDKPPSRMREAILHTRRSIAPPESVEMSIASLIPQLECGA